MCFCLSFVYLVIFIFDRNLFLFLWLVVGSPLSICLFFSLNRSVILKYSTTNLIKSNCPEGFLQRAKRNKSKQKQKGKRKRTCKKAKVMVYQYANTCNIFGMHLRLQVFTTRKQSRGYESICVCKCSLPVNSRVVMSLWVSMRICKVFVSVRSRVCKCLFLNVWFWMADKNSILIFFFYHKVNI